MKHSLLILLVLGLFAAIPLAAQAQPIPIGTEDPHLGAIAQIPGTGILVASDGEAPFQPFGVNFDVSDAIQFDVHVQLIDGGPANSSGNVAWQTIDGGRTWVLPADLTPWGWGIENNVTFEPKGLWEILDTTHQPPQGEWALIDPDGAVGDLITIHGNVLSFQSDAEVPEPGCAVAIAGMCGMGLAGLVWRRRAA
jgi:hypothetical protein